MKKLEVGDIFYLICLSNDNPNGEGNPIALEANLEKKAQSITQVARRGDSFSGIRGKAFIGELRIIGEASELANIITKET